MTSFVNFGSIFQDTQTVTFSSINTKGKKNKKEKQNIQNKTKQNQVTKAKIGTITKSNFVWVCYLQVFKSESKIGNKSAAAKATSTKHISIKRRNGQNVTRKR